MKFALRFLFGLLSLALFGCLVGAMAGAAAGFLIGLGVVVIQHESFSNLPFMAFTGALAGAIVGPPAGWLVALFRRGTTAMLAVGGYMALWCGYVLQDMYSADTATFVKMGCCVGIAALTGRFLFTIQRNLLGASFYTTGLDLLRLSRPSTSLGWTGLILSLMSLFGGVFQLYACWRHGNEEWHLAQSQNELLRLLVDKHDHPPCLCPKPARIDLWSLDQAPADGNLRHVEYLVGKKRLTVESDPGSGWSGRWENLSIDDLRRLAQQGATLDTLSRRGYRQN